jgi:hypothetical protein
MSSIVRFPGTIVTGMGNVPAFVPAARGETSGPGPRDARRQNAEVEVLFDELHDLLGLIALADDASRSISSKPHFLSFLARRWNTALAF